MTYDELNELEVNSEDNPQELDLLNGTDFCPVHNTEVKREYTFGMGDATIYVYENCPCACCLDDFNNELTYHESYQDAKGQAILIRVLILHGRLIYIIRFITC